MTLSLDNLLLLINLTWPVSSCLSFHDWGLAFINCKYLIIIYLMRFRSHCVYLNSKSFFILSLFYFSCSHGALVKCTLAFHYPLNTSSFPLMSKYCLSAVPVKATWLALWSLVSETQSCCHCCVSYVRSLFTCK